MEKPILQGCSNCSALRKGADATPNPSSWENLTDICWDVFSCLNSSGPCGKRLIVHFSLPGTQIHIDIGNVKAAGILCVLGISFGIGTYVLYKIYDRYFRPSPPRKPKTSRQNSTDVENNEEKEDLCEITGHEEMGNQQSSPVDIPVYYKAGYGVSLYKPVENNGKLRNRKPGANVTHAAECILNGNIQQRNGLVPVENSNGEFQIPENVTSRNVRNRAPNFNQLRIEIDESGFVDEEAGLEGNVEKLSNSLKGNFSPTSLCEKNLRLGYESDLETDEFKPDLDILNAALVNKNNNTAKSEVPLHVNHLGPNLHASSVLLTPPPECESSSSSHVISSKSPQISRNSTKSDISDIHSEVVEAIPAETDDEREQLSPLPYDRSLHNTPEKLCPRKLKLKLGEIISRNSSQSASSSGCTSPESGSNGYRRKGSIGFDKENSISGVSSPELELLNSENTDVPVVNTGTFVKLEDEIHTVENEFESISKEIQELTNKYSNREPDQGSEILKEIFLRYPSIRIRQSERGIFYSMSDNENDSRHNSEMVEEDNDLSWDLENVMDMVYSESSELESAAKSLQEKISKAEHEKSERLHSVGNSSVLSTTCSSVNCSVDLGGSMYEDEFHLHLGTTALPRIEEQSPSSDNCDEHLNKISKITWQQDHDSNNVNPGCYECYDADCSSSLQTDSSKQTSSENGQSHSQSVKSVNHESSSKLRHNQYSADNNSYMPDSSNEDSDCFSTINQAQLNKTCLKTGGGVNSLKQHELQLETSLPANGISENESETVCFQREAGYQTGSNHFGTGSPSESQNGSKDLQRDQRSETENGEVLTESQSTSDDCLQGEIMQKDLGSESESSSVYHDVEEGLVSPVSLNTLCNIGERLEIEQYASAEWKGDTPRAQLMKQAYRAIPTHCQCCHLRRIRGDNYCGIRGAVFQTLVNCLPPLTIWASKDMALRSLEQAFTKKSSGIQAWNFGNRISYTSDTKLEVMQRCVSALYAKIEEMKQHSSYTEREQSLVTLLNSDFNCDLDLMEGVKLLMLLSAIRLRSDMEQGNDVPVFAWLMFARDTSETVPSFVRNHLNHVGDSGGLEQVEMCLLGYSLGVRIRVFRLRQFHDEDFISFYPEDGTESWPVVSLIAEDDRHYNVPVL